MDASYIIQRGIHVHLIQFFMCPEFWVHIIGGRARYSPLFSLGRSFHIVLMTLKESRGVLIAVGIIRNCCCITAPSELTIGAMFR